ncbi:MAG: putative transrane protein, partial [Blastococcus sp.]|nr:putative transrane protein [Blastococcus sp.]
GSAHLEVDVPLSEHEQRLLEQIERALVDDDPKFASSVRTGDRRLKARRKLQLGALLVVVGMAVLVGGAVAQSFWVGALGSLIAFGGVALAVLNYKAATGVVEAGSTQPGRGPAASGRSARSGRAGRQPLKNRLEERFRRRYDQ